MIFFHLITTFFSEFNLVINIDRKFIVIWPVRFSECVPLTISCHLYFHRISKISSMLHHGSVSVEQIHSKECYFIFTYTFLAFVVAFLY